MRRTLLSTAFAGLLFLGGCAGGGGYYRVSTGPPPIRVEARGVSPGAGYYWTNGYWGYSRNRYNWVPGRWQRPPRGRSTWVEPRWEQRGDRYEFRRGEWR